MKNRAFLIAVFLFISAGAFAQAKIGYVDSKVIIDGMQDAKDAQANLDNFVAAWQNEIKNMNDSLTIVKEDFEKKKLILTENIKKQNHTEIFNSLDEEERDDLKSKITNLISKIDLHISS